MLQQNRKKYSLNQKTTKEQIKDPFAVICCVKAFEPSAFAYDVLTDLVSQGKHKIFFSQKSKTIMSVFDPDIQN